jgi:hypothetical protein
VPLQQVLHHGLLPGHPAIKRRSALYFGYHSIRFYFQEVSMRPLSRFAVFALIACPIAAAALAAGCSDDTGGSGATSTTGSASGGTGGREGTGGTETGTGGAGGTGTAAGGAGGTGTAAGGAGGTGTAAGGAGGAGGEAPMMIATCQSKIYQCGDLLDNDNDGLIDSKDPDCLGPCDNTENSYYGGIPGQAGPACTVDCYFDSDSGAGNDNCYWNHKCDPNEVAPNYYPEPSEGAQCAYNPNANTPGTGSSCEQLNATQSQVCHDVCGPLTPNGCDCFGCCELPSGSGKYVWLGSTDLNDQPSCKIADLADPDKCHPCKPVDACLNTCGKCEICVGKETLPPECFPPVGAGGAGQGGSGQGGMPGTGGTGGGEMQCPAGIQACGLPGQPPCPFNKYCITGCCQVIPS